MYTIICYILFGSYQFGIRFNTYNIILILRRLYFYGITLNILSLLLVLTCY